MSKYWLVFRLSLLDILEYRVDNILRLFRYVIMVTFVMMLWIAVSKETTQLNTTANELVIYYLFSAIVYGLSNYHLDYVEEDIRLGHISKFLLKPISPFWYYFFHEAATALFDITIKSLVLIPLLWFLGYTFQVSWLSLSLFLIYLPLIFYTTFSIYFGLSTLGFWLTQVESIRMSVLFIGRYLSGIFIPALFFPDFFQKILWWLPFSHYAFTPIQIIKNQLSFPDGLRGLGILITWMLVFTIFRVIIWRLATHSYESTGI
ncbi:MAG TPA: ABC-2 family transporter protein [Vitreimonas sp.]|nr:ABC-2 family transporter protein [Vitreimonas sp.]